MLVDCQYKAPARSMLGRYKFTPFGLYAERREQTKKFGKEIAPAFRKDVNVFDKFSTIIRVAHACGVPQHYAFETFASADVVEASAQCHNRCGQEWLPVPWSDKTWYAVSAAPYLHVAHMSHTQPGMIAYAETPQKLVADRFTIIKPGRYLTRFFGHMLSEGEIRLLAEKAVAQSQPFKLNFVAGNDPDEWVRVYADGPKSCMQGDKSVRVYAHDKSVLRLAYLTQHDNIVARCIVREDHKQYIRIYPTDSGPENTAMRTALEDAGYARGSLEGVLIRMIPANNDRYVCPYIDGAGRVSVVMTGNGQNYLRITEDGELSASETSGYTGEDSRCECDDCGDSYHEDELTYISHNERSVCECCLESNYRLAMGRRCEDYYPEDEVVYCETDDTWYYNETLDYHDVVYCEESNRYYKGEDMVMTSRGYIHIDRVVALDVPDGEGNDHAHSDDVVQTHDGRTIHEDCAVLRTVYFHEDDDIENDQTPAAVTAQAA